jgi:hypothetical protein
VSDRSGWPAVDIHRDRVDDLFKALEALSKEGVDLDGAMIGDHIAVVLDELDDGAIELAS